MLKKLKNKIEEEIKQSPLRLSASVQQIAQAISPSSSQNALQESQNTSASLPDALSVSTDLFSIGDDPDGMDSNKTLHNVDLTATSPTILHTPRSRRSSLSSVASDVSSLFPIYESPLNHSFLLSECESELEDGASAQLERVSKEQLYQGYKKLLYRYNKYKGRFMDLSKLYKDLQYDNMKTKNVLQESQDKSFRRIAELREQCQLEQKAKAHLEESLRNDLEERDHIITTLNTKIGLLKGDGSSMQSDELLIPNLNKDSDLPSDSIEILRKQNQELTSEIDRLKKQMNPPLTFSNGPTLDPVSTEQVKEKITELKSGIVRMKSDNESISNLLSKSPSTSEHGDDNGPLIDLSSPEVDEKDKRIEKLNNLLLKCKEKISGLNMDIRKKNTDLEDLAKNHKECKETLERLNAELAEMRKVEEENVLTIAENKMAIHQELEDKELQIKALTKELQDTKTSLNLTQTKLTESGNTHRNEIENLKKELASAVEEKKELDVKLNETKNEALSHSLNNKIDQQFIGKEKERVSTALSEMLQVQEEKLQTLLDAVNKKLLRAEGKITRICADKLIACRSTEMELLEKIASLENRVQEGGIVSIKAEDLEKEIKTLQEEVAEKERVIDDNTVAIGKLNEELNEKIDRIVLLGDELEETTGRLKLQLESSETKLSNLTKEKAELEEKCKEMWQKSSSLENEIKTLTAEINNLKQENTTLLVEKEQFHINIASLESTSFLNVKQLEESRITLSTIEEQLLSERTEKLAAMKKHDDTKRQLLEQLRNVEMSSKSEASTKIKALEDKVSSIEKEKVQLHSEMEQILNEKGTLLQELEAKIKRLETQLDEATVASTRELEELNNSIVNKEKEISAIAMQLQEKSEALEDLKQAVQVKEERKSTIEAEVAAKIEREVAEKEKAKDECCRLEKCLAEKDEEHRRVVTDFENRLQNIETASATKLEEEGVAKTILQEKVQQLTKLLEDLEVQLSTLRKENELLSSREAAAAGELHRENEEKIHIMEQLRERLKEAEREKLTVNSELSNVNAQLDEKQNEISRMQAVEFSLRSEVNEYEAKLESLTNDLNTAKNDIISIQKTVDGDSEKMKEECESKVNILKNEIKFLNEKFESEVSNIESNREREMEEVHERLVHSENTADELLKKLEGIALERDELRQALEEKSLKVTELESCLSELKSDLDKNFNDKSQTNAIDLEELYEGKLKKIVSEYETELGKRDDNIRDLELQVSEQKDAVESLQILRQEVRTLRKELKNKDDLIETRLEEKLNFEKESENRLLNIKIDNNDLIEEEKRQHEEALRLQKEDMEEELNKQKSEFDRKLRNQKASLDDEIERIRNERETLVREEKSKYDEKIQELQKNFKMECNEWISQKKNHDVEAVPTFIEEDNLSVEDLECTSKVAVAAVESSTDTIELLKQKMMLQDQEIKELKRHHKRELDKIVGTRSRSLSEREPEDVEYEYLRNILYQYMMGREQMVLAKVLAAIVKFDREQTQNVLDRQSSKR